MVAALIVLMLSSKDSGVKLFLRAALLAKALAFMGLVGFYVGVICSTVSLASA